MKVLIVEDDAVIRAAIAELLEHWGYLTEQSADGQQAWDLLGCESFDLLILDLNLPKLDGLELCRRLRARNQPQPLVLMLTARDSLDDTVAGLEGGADDYLVKPFEPALLKARVLALLRRAGRPLQQDWHWGPLQLGLDGRTASFAGTDLHLTPTEHRLLEQLLKAAGRTCSKEQLIQAGWSLMDAPGDESVKTHIKNLRAKLHGAGAAMDLIETVYGVGFRLNCAYLT